MKSKFCIPLLILISFSLMGCPAGNFYRYTFTEKTAIQADFGETRIAISKDTELHIDCGNYVQFIRPKRRGILATIKVVSKSERKKEQLIKNVGSYNYGTLIRTSPFEPELYMLLDTVDMLYFDLSLKNLTHKKIKKGVRNDTISIELQNGRKLLFVKEDSP